MTTQEHDCSNKQGVIDAIKWECKAQGIGLDAQIAYVLATVEWETNRTFNPVQIALFILVHGFRNGTFTGKKIETYINKNKADFVNARRCINGMDKAHEIAHVASNYLNTAFNDEMKKAGNVLIDELLRQREIMDDLIGKWWELARAGQR